MQKMLLLFQQSVILIQVKNLLIQTRPRLFVQSSPIFTQTHKKNIKAFWYLKPFLCNSSTNMKAWRQNGYEAAFLCISYVVLTT